MPSKVPFIIEQHLRNTPLPTHGGRYTVVGHGDIIDTAKDRITKAGFTIKDELYKMTTDGQVAQGVYHLDYAGDPDMGMMFAWSNSYNKSMRFKCAIGAYVFICSNGLVRGDLGSYSRKHSGTALQDVIAQIDNQVAHAKEHYDTLVYDKKMLSDVILSPRDKGKILGELFAHDEILTLTQVGIVKREMDKPTHSYNSDVDSAWTMYNHITFALKESHPGSFMKDHQSLHKYFVDQYGVLNVPSIEVDPIDEEDENDVREDNIASPAGESYIYADRHAYGVNFL